MKLRIAVVLTVAVTFGGVSQSEASAAGRRWRISQSSEPAARPTTIIPSREEIAAVPAPGQGRLVGYALNVYPTARLARMAIGR